MAILLMLSFPAGEILERKINVYPVMYVGVIWLGILSISFTVLLLQHFATLILPQFTGIINPVSLVILGIIIVYSVYNGTYKLKISEITIPVSKKLPQPFSIVQLSDLHLGPMTTIRKVTKIVNKTNQLNPDVIVITGDLIDESVHNNTEIIPVLQTLKSKYGIIAVAGNHEFYAGIGNFISLCKKLNITALRNSKITVNNTVEIAGVDEPSAKRFLGTGPDLKSALKGCDFTKPVILLSHQPDIFKQSAGYNIDLQLSGHTHAGQIPPMDLLVYLTFKYPYGLYRLGKSYLYTSAGASTWGPPMRLFSECEIIKVTLVTL